MGTLRQRAAASFFARSTLKALLGPLWFASATSLATDALKQYKQHVLAGTGASVAGGRASSAVAVVVGRVLVAAGLEWWAGPAVRMAHWLACSTPLWWFAYLFLVSELGRVCVAVG